VNFTSDDRMAFWHIPLPDAYDAEVDLDPSTGEPLIIGQRRDGRGAPKCELKLSIHIFNTGDVNFGARRLTDNSGFFSDAILRQKEVDADPLDPEVFRQARPEVKVTVHGHCHNDDDCRRVQGVWMCFGGGSSYSGYGERG
jgi:hypothetical protein